MDKPFAVLLAGGDPAELEPMLRQAGCMLLRHVPELAALRGLAGAGAAQLLLVDGGSGAAGMAEQEGAAIAAALDLPLVVLSTSRAGLSEHCAWAGRPLHHGELGAVLAMAVYRQQARRNGNWRLAAETPGIGLWDLDLASGAICFSGDWLALLGYPPQSRGATLEGWKSLVHPDDLPLVLDSLQQHLDGVTPVYLTQYRIRHGHSGWKWLQVRGAMSGGAADKAPHLVGTAEDVDERMARTHQMQASLAKVRHLELTLDEHAIVAVTDQNGVITYVNDKFCAISQYERQALIGHTHRLVNSGHHEPEFFRDLWNTISLGGVWKGEIRNRARDGSFYWVDTTIVPFADSAGRPCEYFAIRRDITRQKEAEAVLRHTATQLRELSAHQMSLREAVRKEIARRIHDELGGQLNTLKSYLSVLIGRARRDAGEADPLALQAAEMADAAIETVRNLISELRPSVLDELGLCAALEWYAGQVAERTALRCTCRVDPALDEVALTPDAATAAFRIVQELVSNVLRHAGASAIALDLRLDGGWVEIALDDNGSGIEQAQLVNERSWGIIGMFERAHQCGGELVIGRADGGGTRAVLRLPLRFCRA